MRVYAAMRCFDGESDVSAVFTNRAAAGEYAEKRNRAAEHDDEFYYVHRLRVFETVGDALNHNFPATAEEAA